MRNQYSFSELISTSFALFITKIFYPEARLIKSPVYIRGRSSMSGIKKFDYRGHGCRFDLAGKNKKTLFIGANCEIGDYVHIVAYENVKIGNNVLMATKVFISDVNHGIYKGDYIFPPSTPPSVRQLVTSPVSIGDNVWVGENVVVLAGVKIGDGAIISANSVVTKDIKCNCIAAGTPTAILKRYDFHTGEWRDNKE